MTREKLGELIISSTDEFYRVAKSVLRRDEDCEDAVSEAIVKAFASLGSLRQDHYAKTWFTRILLNECYRIYHQRSKETVYDEIPEKPSEDEGGYSDLYVKMAALDESYRVPIVLYYMNGFTVKEIAGMMDMKESAVKMRLARGRKQLRDMYEKEEAG